MSDEDTRRSSGESEGEEEKAPQQNDIAAKEKAADVPNAVTTVTASEVTAPNPKASGGKKAKPTKRVQLQIPKDVTETNHVQADSVKEPAESTTNEDKEEDEDEDEDVVEEEVAAPTLDFSKVLNSCLALVGFFGGLLRRCMYFIRDAVCRVFSAVQSVFPCVLAVGVYLLISYLVANYLVEQGANVRGFSDRMEYVVRGMALVSLPTVLGLLAQRVRSSPKKLSGQSLEDTVLLFFNSLVLASHLDEDCFHCLYVFFLVTTAYRLTSWVVQVYFSNSTLQYFLNTPVQLSHIALGLYNTYSIVGKDIGLFAPPTATMATQTDGPGMEEGEAEWVYPDFCGVVEKMFCQVPGTPPRFYGKA